jgi:RND family efflux transporter MFP subunit
MPTLSKTFIALLLASGLVSAQTDTVSTDLTEVVTGSLDKRVKLPGELKPFQKVEIHAKVTGFVDKIEVDRGSRVKQGQLLATMVAPEFRAQRLEAQAKIPAIEAQRGEAEVQLAAAESTFATLSEAAKTPGVVAGHDVILAEKAVEAERARVVTMNRSITSIEAQMRSIEEIENYLRIAAPFNGVITERQAHIGSLAGPESGTSKHLFTLEQTSRLRLEVAVPEAYIESVRNGTQVIFTVPAYPGQEFSGVVSRPAGSVDPETRTMAVELDVSNSSGKLAPGMYAEISWPLRRASDSLFVPPSAIKATTEKIFVVRVKDGKAQWIDVRRGMTQGDLVEVFGDELQGGDTIVLRATDEIRPGYSVTGRN